MQTIAFLLDGVVGFFTTLFLLRFIMQCLRVSFSGQLGDFVVQLTNWAVKPLRRLIPGVGGLDWASLLPAVLLEILLAIVLLAPSGAFGGADPAQLWPWIFLHALRSLARQAVYIFIGALILQAVMSWINPYSPLAAPAYQLTRPLLAPIQRILPAISGIDLSPLVAILLLQALLAFL